MWRWAMGLVASSWAGGADAADLDVDGFKAWVQRYGTPCEWGQVDLGEGPALFATLRGPKFHATVVAFEDERWALFAGDSAECPDKPVWHAPEGQRELSRSYTYGNNQAWDQLAIRGGKLVELDRSDHALGSMPMPPFPPIAWSGCHLPPYRVTDKAHADEKMFVTPIGSQHYDPARRTPSVKPVDGPFSMYAPPDALSCEPLDGPETQHPIAMKGTTQLAVTYGASRWTGLDDGSLSLQADLDGDDLVIDIAFEDDQVAKVAEATPAGFLKGDHLEIWWVAAGYDAGEPVWFDAFDAEVDADWGPVPKDYREELGSEAVKAIEKRLQKTRQLGIARVDGTLKTVWLHPEGLDEEPPDVKAIDGGVQVRLPRSRLTVDQHEADWWTRFTAVLHDVDDGKVSMIATSLLHWGAPGSFGLIRSFGASPYEPVGKPVEEGADPFEVIDY